MAGSLTNAAETALLTLLFNNTDWANIGDAGGLQNSAAAGSFYVALFTSDPGEAGGGSECDYTNYARVAVARSGAGWTIAGNNVSNTAAITFPTAGVTAADVATHFAIMTSAAPGGDMIVYGEITDPVGGLTIDDGITPEFAIGALDINCD